MRPLSRRGLARLVLRLAALSATAGRAWSADDRGLGGTGVVPVDPNETLGQDRGIGGTGVVGTIRRFGSIEVNDLKVNYDPDVRVTIDGRAASAAALRLGQVVRVLAHDGSRGLATRTIAVAHEVVGAVEGTDDDAFFILGQRIVPDDGVGEGVSPGAVVAVSGLRRIDGTIVASLVTPVDADTPARIAGPIRQAQDGGLGIGAQSIVGLDPALAGRRVAITGPRSGTTFSPTAVALEPSVPFALADRISIEGYATESGGMVRFGSGYALPAERSLGLAGSEDVHAVITAEARGRGHLVATGVHTHRGRSRGRAAPGPGQQQAPVSGGRSGAGARGGRGGGGQGQGGGRGGAAR